MPNRLLQPERGQISCADTAWSWCTDVIVFCNRSRRHPQLDESRPICVRCGCIGKPVCGSMMYKLTDGARRQEKVPWAHVTIHDIMPLMHMASEPCLFVPACSYYASRLSCISESGMLLVRY